MGYRQGVTHKTCYFDGRTNGLAGGLALTGKSSQRSNAQLTTDLQQLLDDDSCTEIEIKAGCALTNGLRPAPALYVSPHSPPRCAVHDGKYIAIAAANSSWWAPVVEQGQNSHHHCAATA